MTELFTFLRESSFIVTLVATILQGLGTLVLALFSFYGLSITENKEAYLESIPKVEINKSWLRASQFALIALLIGILLSGALSLANLNTTT